MFLSCKSMIRKENNFNFSASSLYCKTDHDSNIQTQFLYCVDFEVAEYRFHDNISFYKISSTIDLYHTTFIYVFHINQKRSILSFISGWLEHFA